MPPQVRLHQILDWDSPQQCAHLRRELASGLLQAQASIAPKFFYDSLGSRLFEAITELPEYYPTRTEAAIFAEHLPAIRQALGKTSRSLISVAAVAPKPADSFMPASCRLVMWQWIFRSISCAIHCSTCSANYRRSR
jgi:uncharacterized SAM-dependent methyltransferase